MISSSSSMVYNISRHPGIYYIQQGVMMMIMTVLRISSRFELGRPSSCWPHRCDPPGLLSIWMVVKFFLVWLQFFAQSMHIQVETMRKCKFRTLLYKSKLNHIRCCNTLCSGAMASSSADRIALLKVLHFQWRMGCQNGVSGM